MGRRGAVVCWVDSCQSATGVGSVVPREHSEARDSLLERRDKNDTVRKRGALSSPPPPLESRHQPDCCHQLHDMYKQLPHSHLNYVPCMNKFPFDNHYPFTLFFFPVFLVVSFYTPGLICSPCIPTTRPRQSDRGSRVIATK